MGEIGLAGPILFLVAALAIIVWCERRTRFSQPDAYTRAVALATASATAGILIYGLFDTQLAFTVGSLNLLAGALLAFGLHA